MNEKVIWRRDLRKRLGVSCQTMRNWERSNRLPNPDIALTQKSIGWYPSTLRAAGIEVAD